jgi:hypothetical protein
MRLGMWRVGTNTHLRTVSPKQRLKCCCYGEKHTANYCICSKWKEAKAASAKRAKGERGRKDGVPHPYQRPNQPQLNLLPNRRNQAPAGTTKSEVAAPSRLSPRPTTRPLHPAQEDGPSGWVPRRVANVRPLDMNWRWWIPNHPVPSSLTRHRANHGVTLR